MKQLVIGQKITNRANESFNQYLKEISMIEVLTPQEEIRLSERTARGDKAAIDEMVKRNLRFVVSVAKQYATNQNPLEDLVNEGNIGLYMAAEKFKPEMGFRFISYAVWWIRKVIMEHLGQHGRMVRLPANRINGISKLEKKLNTLEQELGRPVTVQELIDNFGAELSPKMIEEYELLGVLNTYSMESLDRDISGEEGNGTTLADTMSDESIFQATDQGLLNQDIKQELTKALDGLKPREREVIIAIYGLDGQLPRTLNDIGDQLGVTREMVRQVRQKALAKLKDKLEVSELFN